MLLSSLYAEGCSLAGIWRGGLWGHGRDGRRHLHPGGSCCFFL